MKKIQEMTQLEITAYVQTHLLREGIQTVLSGGAAVSYYIGNRYVIKDADLVNSLMESQKRLRESMETIGFQETGWYFDRLSAFYHWNDLQTLQQALMVVEKYEVDLDEIMRWSEVEGKIDKFTVFEEKFKKPS